MILYLLEIISLLIFWKFADFKRFREMIPILFTAAFLRFLEHYIIIDWFKLWSVAGHPIWTPLSANLTIWIVSAYLYIQFLPKANRVIYGLGWVIMMFGYLILIKTAGVFTPKESWKMYYSFLLVCVNYTMIYQLRSWLYPNRSERIEKVLPK